MEIALREMGLDTSVIAAIHDMLDFGEDADKPHPPSRVFVRDTKAMRATAADILEFPNSYVFHIDMPGVKPDQIKVELEEGNMLVVSGERQRDKEREHKEGAKYVRMERRQGKFLKRFELPENANIDSITANYQDGVLTITVQKRPPPEPKKPKTIEIQVGRGQEEAQVGGAGAGGGGSYADQAQGQGQGQGELSEATRAQGEGSPETPAQ